MRDDRQLFDISSGPETRLPPIHVHAAVVDLATSHNFIPARVNVAYGIENIAKLL